MPKGFKAGGRKKGTPNKTTEKAKELFNAIMSRQIDKMESALDEIYGDSKTKYIDAVTKLAQYFLPKKTDITSNDKEIEGFIVKSVSDADRNDSK